MTEMNLSRALLVTFVGTGKLPDEWPIPAPDGRAGGFAVKLIGQYVDMETVDADGYAHVHDDVNMPAVVLSTQCAGDLIASLMVTAEQVGAADALRFEVDQSMANLREQREQKRKGHRL